MSVDKVEAALGALRFISLTASVPPEYDQALSVLTEALAESRRDAARYRWLREGSVPMLCIRADRHKGLHNVRMMGAEADVAIDTAIDAAMKDTDHAR